MPRENAKQMLGAVGEKLGCQYLQQKGYIIVATNYKNEHGSRLGEIDIVAQKERRIVFVEVKTRLDRGVDTPLPEQNITQQKLHKLQKIAWYYLREHKKETSDYAFDGLSIVVNFSTKKAKIRHLEGIFL